MQFIPQDKKALDVPYFEDVSKSEGWQGHGTHKSIKKLQAEVSECINRLGGIVSGFQQGSFLIEKNTRDGFQIHYSMQSPDGRYVPGRLDIAALPVRNRRNEATKEKALCMALYMLRTALEGMWFMQQLSPGYAALMPWMLADKDKTVSQLWAESPVMNNLLPPGDAEFTEAEVIDG